KQGSLATAMMGHANTLSFFSMVHRDQAIEYTAEDARGELANGPPNSPLLLFSCEAGDFSASQRCLAESLFFLPAGPAAVIAATTQSHPLTNFFTGIRAIKGLGGKEKRLGLFWLEAQRRARTDRDFLMELALRDVEGKLEREIDVPKL